MNKQYSNLRKELEAGRPIITFTTGVSMEPLLHDKRKKNATSVLVVPVNSPLSVGDMPLVQIKEDTYMIHRVIEVREEDGQVAYVTRGDNCIGCEQVKASQVLGIVTEIYEGDKKICVTDKKYLRYVKRRMRNYPFRVIWWRVRRLVSIIKRILL